MCTDAVYSSLSGYDRGPFSIVHDFQPQADSLSSQPEQRRQDSKITQTVRPTLVYIQHQLFKVLVFAKHVSDTG